jgi:Protein of unknown function (DUF2510)
MAEPPGATWQAGWYPDPQHVADERYWDGSKWTPQVREVRLRTPEERTDLLERQIRTETAKGWRLESSSRYTATLVKGKPVNHVLHLILTIVTVGLWGIVWIILALGGGERRTQIAVDEYGNVVLTGTRS